ncbi:MULTISPECIES: hypothetical protein [unclassified Corallococcus]|uniref:hypothetical protein n=1 Tax=unclassified Corallococcus TaxID=2685029 RepID=UPI001A8D8499|nr:MULTISPECIES: hypothetical protein [unclassified Corallococcus]MBN9683613.1 hypothetical protein [Corallococcus sp. NCSPR001]WAS84875.1 hypothetical protein O0N60_37140 [Corallococcus sp. NCRR]
MGHSNSAGFANVECAKGQKTCAFVRRGNRRPTQGWTHDAVPGFQSGTGSGGGESIYQAVAVQRSGDAFVVFFFELPEALMYLEENAVEVRRRFETLELALAFLEEASGTDVRDMTPMKGGKLFRLNE